VSIEALPKEFGCEFSKGKRDGVAADFARLAMHSWRSQLGKLASYGRYLNLSYTDVKFASP
jgi:hypothetical protein